MGLPNTDPQSLATTTFDPLVQTEVSTQKPSVNNQCEVEKNNLEEEIKNLESTVDLLKKELNTTNGFLDKMNENRILQLEEQGAMMNARCDKKMKLLLEEFSVKHELVKIEAESCNAILKREDEQRKELLQRMENEMKDFREMRAEDAADREIERKMRREEIELIKSFIASMKNRGNTQSSTLGLL